MWNVGLFTFSVVFVSVLNLAEVEVAAKSKVPNDAKAAKGPPTYDVKLYTMKQFEGKMVKLKIEEGSCVNLPPSWEKQVSSVDPSGCVILYADSNCKGFRKRLDKWGFGAKNLKDISFDSKLSSLSLCPMKKSVLDEL